MTGMMREMFAALIFATQNTNYYLDIQLFVI